MAAGAETEVARIVELLKVKRGGKSLVLSFGDDQLAVVAEAMVGHGTSAAELRENMLGDASMVDAVSLYFARAVSMDTLPPMSQCVLRACVLRAPCRWPDRRAPRRCASRRRRRQRRSPP